VGDPNEVVIDEIAGQAIALAGLHIAFPGPAPWPGVLAAFALFRLLDVTKPGPIGALERLPGGLGIMADDLLAGLVVALCFPLARLVGAFP
jgi:phosphatidylglycerophosphatase A